MKSTVPDGAPPQAAEQPAVTESPWGLAIE